MAKIKVYPTKATALLLKHPIDGPMRPDGAMWEQDGFTGRMIVDGALTRDESKAFKPLAAPPLAAPLAPAEPSAPPAASAEPKK